MLGGIVMATVAMYGYYLLGDSLDMKGLVLSCVIVVIALYLTNLQDGLEMLNCRLDYYMNLVVGGAYTALTAGYVGIRLYHE